MLDPGSGDPLVGVMNAWNADSSAGAVGAPRSRASAGRRAAVGDTGAHGSSTAGNGICLIVLPAENATRSNRLISPSVVCRLWSVWAFLPKIFSSVSRSLMI